MLPSGLGSGSRGGKKETQLKRSCLGREKVLPKGEQDGEKQSQMGRESRGCADQRDLEIRDCVRFRGWGLGEERDFSK